MSESDFLQRIWRADEIREESLAKSAILKSDLKALSLFIKRTTVRASRPQTDTLRQ